MPAFRKGKKGLKKELRLIDVFAIATGTTLSSGLFLLPGLAAEEAGAGIIFAYLIAALPLIPAMLSIVELSTAMPRAGGVYYFLDRTMGPLIGTVGGVGTWMALILKVSFALIGMGAYISLFFSDIPMTGIAVLIAVVLGALNLFSSKKSGKFQVVLVSILLTILAFFLGDGFVHMNFESLKQAFDVEFNSLLSTAGLVYISYVGITKIASLSEEVKNPERNLPRGIFLSLATALLVYLLGTSVLVGVIPIEQLKGDLTPFATAADFMFGKTGMIIITVAALVAFTSVANAGVMSASRYPLAMSRDSILPGIFGKINKQGAPAVSVVISTVVIILLIVAFDPTKIAKLASAFQLIMFSLVCVAVIVMRESRIESYDPGYKSPWYPWTQIIGIISAGLLIVEMGWLPVLFSTGLIGAGMIWYRIYASGKVDRTGAVYHVFERLGQQRYTGLDSELRGIMKEKGLRSSDPFNEIVLRAEVLDLDENMSFEAVLENAAGLLEKELPLTKEQIAQMVMDGTKVGATPVMRGFALPHFRCQKIDHSIMLLVRARKGVHITLFDPVSGKEEGTEMIHALFFLVSPEEDPTQHLRILAQIAGRVDDPSFEEEWDNALTAAELREALLHDERFLTLVLRNGSKSEPLIGKKLMDASIPKGCLVALLKRGTDTIVPNGSLVFSENDRLTIIGEKEGIDSVREKYDG